MVIDFEYEIHEEVYFILIKNKDNQAYINKGIIEGFEVVLRAMEPVRLIKVDKFFKGIPIVNAFRTEEEAEKRAIEMNINGCTKEEKLIQPKKLGDSDSLANCRGEILEAVKVIIKEKNKNEFSPNEVIKHMKDNRTRYKEGTIKNHIIAKCCINTTSTFGTLYEDFERIDRGLYKLL